MTHERADELLAAFADDGLDGAERAGVAEHVAACDRCAAELRRLRAFLGDVRRAPAGEQRDDAFFRDMARDVRLAYADAQHADKTGVWAWLRRPALIASVCAAAAGALGVAVVMRRPAAPEIAPHALRPVPEVIVDQEDLSPQELVRVLHSFDGEATPPQDEDMALAPSGGAEVALETLDEDALQRLETEL
jgi:anti-sigma factor RsiW